MSTPDSEAGIRVYDTSEPLIPYTSQTCSDEEWCSAAVGKWEEMGLPESAVPDPLWERCYIRWGDMPKGGQSFNHQLRELEPGVAVFRSYKAGKNDYRLDLQKSPTLGILFVRLSTSGRRLYRVYGNECHARGGGG